jgi:hypothetical protein
MNDISEVNFVHKHSILTGNLHIWTQDTHSRTKQVLLHMPLWLIIFFELHSTEECSLKHYYWASQEIHSFCETRIVINVFAIASLWIQSSSRLHTLFFYDYFKKNKNEINTSPASHATTWRNPPWWRHHQPNTQTTCPRKDHWPHTNLTSLSPLESDKVKILTNTPEFLPFS